MDDPLPPAPGLLPAGLVDRLPPEAGRLADLVARLMAAFAAHGYARVDPPLLEFEDSLLAGGGAVLSEQIFRVLDPASHRMLGLRADITPQVARLAATRLAAAPRPLRLAYAGACVRVRGGQTDPGRQVTQVGLELIGPDSAAADAETILVAAEALGAIGLARISVDLTLPTLAPALLRAHPAREALTRAIDRKDMAEIGRQGGALAPLLTGLVRAAGPAPQAIAAMREAGLPPTLRALADRLGPLVERLARRAPSLRLTVDPMDFRGMRYHTGIAFTIYAPGRHGTLGRGGRYRSGEHESATGVTLYAEALLRAAPAAAPPGRVFVPDGQEGAALRQAGYETVAALGDTADPRAEARRLGCTHLLDGASVVEL
jgi:ATP phosphoribosyltransferase regulatory subunit